MCGIIGGYGITTTQMRGYIKRLKHRGTDGFGVMHSNGTKVVINKSKKVINTCNTVGSISEFMIIHNRAASIGGTSLKNVHPATTGRGNNVVATMQNGTNRELHSLYGRVGETDTKTIARMLEVIDTLPAIVKIFKGSGNIFSLHKDKLVVHIDGERPLLINKDRTLFASEPITEGEWFNIIPTVAIFDGIADFMENCAIQNTTSVAAGKTVCEYCVHCNKYHLHNIKSSSGVCLVCEAKGVFMEANTYSQTSGSVYINGWIKEALTRNKVKIYVKTPDGGVLHHTGAVSGKGRMVVHTLDNQTQFDININTLRNSHLYLGGVTGKKARYMSEYGNIFDGVLSETNTLEGLPSITVVAKVVVNK